MVSEASQGSIEVLDKSTTSQWSVSEAENAYEAAAASARTNDDEPEAGKQPDSMTPDEAEILLSSRSVTTLLYKCRRWSSGEQSRLFYVDNFINKST